jgi:hypothetical protein
MADDKGFHVLVAGGGELPPMRSKAIILGTDTALIGIAGLLVAQGLKKACLRRLREKLF